MHRSGNRLHRLLGRFTLCLLLCAALCACQKPLHIAFLGGLTGRVADLGVGGRDGTLLAVEQVNLAGGVSRRQVQLHTFDDQQQADRLPALRDAMLNADVAGVVGPMTSVIAAAWIPLAEASGLTTVSPTVTSSDFSGHDDVFFRVTSDTHEYARASAAYYTSHQGWRRFALILDDSNAAYSRSWVRHFRQAALEFGASWFQETAFNRSDPASPGLADALAQALTHQPDALVVVASASDTVQLAQMLRKRDQRLPLVATEWAATEQLLLLGGRAVEGMRVAQFINPQDQSASFARFKQDFEGRFGRKPGFAESAAFDATHALLQALGQQQADEPLKATLYRIGRFPGVQQAVVFDRYGDSKRQVFMTEIRQGQYRVLEWP